jgi:hypothetical protein
VGTGVTTGNEQGVVDTRCTNEAGTVAGTQAIESCSANNTWSGGALLDCLASQRSCVPPNLSSSGIASCYDPNGATLYHGWTTAVPNCNTTSYNALLATDDGGYYPYNIGDSNACRAWKLAATICNSQPQPYYDTIDFYCPSSGGFTDPVFGTFCAVTNQYSCSGCPAACNAACYYTPNSLRNCSGFETNQN